MSFGDTLIERFDDDNYKGVDLLYNNNFNDIK